MKRRKTNKKAVLWFTSFLALILIGAARPAKAEIDKEVKLKGDCYYVCDMEYEEIEVIGIREGVKNPVIPDTINGMKVKAVRLDDDYNEYDFKQGEKNIDTLTIPRYVYRVYVTGNFRVKDYIVHKKNKEYCSRAGCLYSKDKTTLIYYPNGKKTKSFTIPNGTKKIKDAAFMECQVEDVSMPNSVTEMGNDAFFLSKLKSIKLSSKLKGIGMDTFYKTELRSIVLPKRVKSIEWSAFEGCEWLESVTIPKNVEYIGESAFQGCKRLESVTILKGNHLGTIDAYAFRGCRRLKKFIFPKTLKRVREKNLRNSVWIGKGAFRDCGQLEKVVISDLNSIGNRCFYNCKRLKEVTLNEQSFIDSYAFYKCKSLQQITLKGRVWMEKGAFQKCGKLKEIRIASKSKKGKIHKEAFVKAGEKKKLTIIAPKNSYAYNYAKKHKKQGLKVKALK